MNIEEFLDSKCDEILCFAKKLVQINSAHGNETAVCHEIRKKLNEYGIASETFGADKKRQNMFFSVGHGKRTLLFNGHMDTVPAGDETAWLHPPFDSVVEGGRLYGRGSSDMKGGLASLVFAAIALARCAFQGRAAFLFTWGEESGMEGMQEAIGRVKADACICGDGSNKYINIGHRGGMGIEFTVHGKAAHTGSLSDEGKGIHAVLKMAAVLLALQHLKMRFAPHRNFLPPKLTPGTLILGGVADNIIPEKCTAMIDCRLSLGQNPGSVLEDIEQCLKPLRENDVQLRYSMKVKRPFPPFLVDEKEPVVQALKRAAENILGGQVPLRVSGGGVDANIIAAEGVPCAVFGAEGGNMHAENEWVSIKSLTDTAKIHVLAALSFLNSA